MLSLISIGAVAYLLLLVGYYVAGFIKGWRG
jgi:hypothetical protein